MKVKYRIVSVFMFLVILMQTLNVYAADMESCKTVGSEVDIEKNEIVQEDTAQRNLFEKHYLLEDGSCLAVTYPEQVCYLDEYGNWLEIDNSLEQIGNRLENKNSPLKVSFANEVNDETVKLTNHGVDFTWSLSFSSELSNNLKQLENDEATKDITSMMPKVEYNDATNSSNATEDLLTANNIESHVTYKNVFFDSVDVQYTVFPNRVKENVILNSPTEFLSYTMHVTCNDLTAELTQENGIVFYNAEGKKEYEVLTPYMFDDIYELSYDIEIKLTKTDVGYDITLMPDQTWLASEDRVYPIIIDPTVQTGTNKVNFSDTYVFEGSTASESRALEERLRVGIYNGKVHRVLWKTSVLPTIPQNATINSATFKLKFPDATTTSRTFSLYKINSSWASYTITWTQATALSTTLLNSSVSRNSSANTLTFSGSNITNAVKSWYSGTANNGFLIRYTSESLSNPDYNVFYSSDNTTSTSYMPCLMINYTSTGAVLPLTEYPVNSYFSDNGGECTHHKINSNNCSFLNESACNCKIYHASIQCMGFAKYVYAKYANMTDSNFSTLYNNGTEKSNYNYSFSGSATRVQSILQSLPTGAYVRFTRSSGNGHSVIILSTSGSGITVYDCNWDKDCKVGSRTESYSSLAQKFSGVEFTMSHNLSQYSQYNATYHKKTCTKTGCNGYILENHSTSGTCVCGYSG